MPKLHTWLPATAQNAKLLLRHMLRNRVFLSITPSSKSLIMKGAQSIQQFPVTQRQLFRQLFLFFSCLGKHQLGLEGFGIPKWRSTVCQLCWTIEQWFKWNLRLKSLKRCWGPTKYNLTSEAIAWLFTKKGNKRLIFVFLAHNFENTRHNYHQVPNNDIVTLVLDSNNLHICIWRASKLNYHWLIVCIKLESYVSRMGPCAFYSVFRAGNHFKPSLTKSI